MTTKRTLYATNLPCPSCKITMLIRLRAWPVNHPAGLLPQQVHERYSVLYCVDCDGDLGAAARLQQQRNS